MLSTQKRYVQQDPESGQIEIVQIVMLPTVTVVLFVKSLWGCCIVKYLTMQIVYRMPNNSLSVHFSSIDCKAVPDILG